ncbi:hypothetical protein [Novipirellula artificiosorum]|uniref:Uncharacterized protein n=1 Tax=Novipirellula artificiosorum TaxID=2528016 RepID=A0A5C6DHI9_9BACT|nr:hypothetical protein [Novipirellula artificiosorum]TWU35171.1 hypothetical protein Poly41_43200 [Novipirellula artificiosorum]
MTDKLGIPERIGAAINELDIDFSRFSLVGWIVSLLSLIAGGGVAYLVCMAIVRRNGLDRATGMVFCITVISISTLTFLALRRVAQFKGWSITKREDE